MRFQHTSLFMIRQYLKLWGSHSFDSYLKVPLRSFHSVAVFQSVWGIPRARRSTPLTHPQSKLRQLFRENWLRFYRRVKCPMHRCLRILRPRPFSYDPCTGTPATGEGNSSQWLHIIITLIDRWCILLIWRLAVTSYVIYWPLKCTDTHVC